MLISVPKNGEMAWLRVRHSIFLGREATTRTASTSIILGVERVCCAKTLYLNSALKKDSLLIQARPIELLEVIVRFYRSICLKNKSLASHKNQQSLRACRVDVDGV